jgi:hypothetical protein
MSYLRTLTRAAFALLLGLLAGIGIATFSSPALADVVFTLGNNPCAAPCVEQNISFGAKETGTTITGTIDNTNTTVYFSTLTGQTLLQNSNGQAQIFQNVAMPSQNSKLTSMDINLTGANTTAGTGVANATLGFQDFILNLVNGSGTAQVEAFDNLGQKFEYTLGNGQNFLTLTTKNNEIITDVQVMMVCPPSHPRCTLGSFTEFKQPRISGVDPVAPLPAALPLFIGGLGLIGVAGFRKKRRVSRLAL